MGGAKYKCSAHKECTDQFRLTNKITAQLCWTSQP